ncbi:MAG: heme exporter protein CcmD [Gammaproteobacteria bacterium]|nr:heme exporter protein CcmD [Gammaproteobacteria bacterium]
MLTLLHWLNMGGYATYVWLSYGVVWCAIAGMVVYILAIERDVHQRARLELKNKHASCS